MAAADRPSHRIEPFWDAQLAILAVIGLYAALPEGFSLGPRWLVPALGVVVLIALARETPYGRRRTPQDSARRRTIAIVLTGGLSAVNAVALGVLVHRLISGLGGLSGRTLLFAAAIIWAAAVALFAVWYWELDRGGPTARSQPGAAEHPQPDFFFPQMDDGVPAPKGWMPGFFDYLYLSFTNQTAFSPTDVMPLTQKAKLAMLLQSVASFVTVALVAARAVNILG